MGQWLKGRVRATRVVLTSLGSSVLFYLITNGAVWWFSGMYAHTLEGFVLCYYYAIPFFRNTIFGNLAYSCGVFLAWALVPVLVGKLQNVSFRGEDELSGKHSR